MQGLGRHEWRRSFATVCFKSRRFGATRLSHAWNEWGCLRRAYESWPIRCSNRSPVRRGRATRQRAEMGRCVCIQERVARESPTDCRAFARSAFSICLSRKPGYSHIAQPAEPPYADPHVRWCGRGGQATVPLSRLRIISSAAVTQHFSRPPPSQESPSSGEMAPDGE